MFITDQKCYSGELIHTRFAYKYFRDKTSATGNIVSFVGPSEVTINLIDLEDALSKDYIYSEKMINFCWEIPCIKDCFGAIAFQRLFNTGLADILAKYVKAPINVDGDDIMVMKEHKQGGVIQTSGKASVSITHMVGEAAIGHTGINIVAGNRAPAFAFSTNLSDSDAEKFRAEVEQFFYWLTEDIFIASSKIL